LVRIKNNHMIKLKNPYATLPGYNCFGCSPTNTSGLKMEFYEEGEEIISTWIPDPLYQGFHDILHGGIQATMMDEIASWAVFVKLDTAGVTYQLKTRFRKPVHLSKGPITLRAKIEQVQRSIASIAVSLMDAEGTRCSESMVDYFLLSREKAEKEMHYPGWEFFYP
jgi:acyl-coenzyme A thioesterase PaaI-like protein